MHWEPANSSKLEGMYENGALLPCTLAVGQIDYLSSRSVANARRSVRSRLLSEQY
jgi:hypothetical protein